MLCANHFITACTCTSKCNPVVQGLWGGEGRGGGRKSPDCFLALSLLFAVL